MKLRCHSHSDLCKKMCIITVELVIEVMKDLRVRIDLVTPAWLSYVSLFVFGRKVNLLINPFATVLCQSRKLVHASLQQSS